jgi:heme O synthase-like polyprenyltransferase
MESAAEAARRTATEVTGGDAARPVRAVRPVELPDGQRSAASVLRDYVALTKPRIISLLLLTTVASMFVADPSGPALSTVLWTMLGGYLAAGGAGAINQYLERDADARMARTRGRPLASGRIAPLHGLAFGIALGALAVIVLVAVTLLPVAGGLFGLPYLSAALALGGAFIGLAAWLCVRPSRPAALRLYLASLAYLALLFAFMALDRAVW